MATLFVATSAQSYQFTETNVGTFNQAWPTAFPDSELLKAHTAGFSTSSDYVKECSIQAQFERNVQTAVLAGSGVVVATFFSCIFAEWLQEFKVRKAEKAKLIARLQCETHQIQATCQAA